MRASPIRSERKSAKEEKMPFVVYVSNNTQIEHLFHSQYLVTQRLIHYSTASTETGTFCPGHQIPVDVSVEERLQESEIKNVSTQFGVGGGGYRKQRAPLATSGSCAERSRYRADA